MTIYRGTFFGIGFQDWSYNNNKYNNNKTIAWLIGVWKNKEQNNQNRLGPDGTEVARGGQNDNLNGYRGERTQRSSSDTWQIGWWYPALK